MAVLRWTALTNYAVQ